MAESRRAAHTVYSLHYHFVFITKYRKPVLTGDIGTEVRDLVREICRTLDIEIVQGHVRPEHVHLLLSVPPHLAPSRAMQWDDGVVVPQTHNFRRHSAPSCLVAPSFRPLR
jgi:putative transposase